MSGSMPFEHCKSPLIVFESTKVSEVFHVRGKQERRREAGPVRLSKKCYLQKTNASPSRIWQNPTTQCLQNPSFAIDKPTAALALRKIPRSSMPSWLLFSPVLSHSATSCETTRACNALQRATLSRPEVPRGILHHLTRNDAAFVIVSQWLWVSAVRLAPRGSSLEVRLEATRGSPRRLFEQREKGKRECSNSLSRFREARWSPAGKNENQQNFPAGKKRSNFRLSRQSQTPAGKMPAMPALRRTLRTMHVYQCMWHRPRCSKIIAYERSRTLEFEIFTRTKISAITVGDQTWRDCRRVKCGCAAFLPEFKVIPQPQILQAWHQWRRPTFFWPFLVVWREFMLEFWLKIFAIKCYEKCLEDHRLQFGVDLPLLLKAHPRHEFMRVQEREREREREGGGGGGMGELIGKATLNEILDLTTVSFPLFLLFFCVCVCVCVCVCLHCFFLLVVDALMYTYSQRQTLYLACRETQIKLKKQMLHDSELFFSSEEELQKLEMSSEDLFCPCAAGRGRAFSSHKAPPDWRCCFWYSHYPERQNGRGGGGGGGGGQRELFGQVIPCSKRSSSQIPRSFHRLTVNFIVHCYLPHPLNLRSILRWFRSRWRRHWRDLNAHTSRSLYYPPTHRKTDKHFTSSCGGRELSSSNVQQCLKEQAT